MNWKPYLTIAIVSLLSHYTGMDALAQKVVQSGAVTIQVPSGHKQRPTLSIM